jgi:hypothetical protein
MPTTDETNPIVEVLRRQYASADNTAAHGHSHDAMIDGANEIEHLQAELAAARRQLAEYIEAANRDVGRRDADITRLTKMNEDFCAAIATTGYANFQLTAERNYLDALLMDLHHTLATEHKAGMSSNDFCQAVDAWFTEHGYQTIIYS